MTFDEISRARFSCRGFRPDPVPAETLRRIFETAQRTASWCNTQPWRVHLLSDAAVPGLSAALLSDVEAGRPDSPDLDVPERYVGVYQERRRAAGFALYEAVGIARDDRPGRAGQALENLRFFGASHVAIVTTDRAQGTYGALDCGGFVANVLNAATAEGVDTIAQAAIAVRSATVREFLALPEDRLVVCGVALGYAEPDHRANGFRTTRAEQDEVVVHVDRAPSVAAV